jgi:hypothetical protein
MDDGSLGPEPSTSPRASRRYNGARLALASFAAAGLVVERVSYSGAGSENADCSVYLFDFTQINDHPM